MACVSLIALPKVCGAEGRMGGLEKVYFIAAKDLAPASGVAGTPIYTTTTGGVVSDIGLASGKLYVEVGLYKSSSDFKETMTKDFKNGTLFYTQDFTLLLSDITLENKAFLDSVVNQAVSIVMKTRTGKYFVAGLNGQFELSALQGGTGGVETDLIGYNLTFSGIDVIPVQMVDSSLITTIVG